MPHSHFSLIGYLQKEGEDTFAVYIGGHIADDLIRNFDKKVNKQSAIVTISSCYVLD